MMKYLVLKMGMAVLSIAVAVPAMAAAHVMKPGLWTLTVNMKMARHPRLQAESVLKRCIKPEDRKNGRFIPEFPKRPDMNCSLKNFSRNGNTATYTRVCTGPRGNTTSEGKLTFNSSTSFDAEIHTTGLIGIRHIDTTRTVHAKRVGDCSD